MVFALLFPSLFPCSARPSPSKVRPRAERCAGRSRIERPRLFPSLLRDDLLRRVSSFFFILSLSLSFTPCRRRFTVRCYYGCGVAVTIRPNPVNPVHSASRAAHWYALVDGGISFDEYALDRGGKKTFLLGFRFFLCSRRVRQQHELKPVKGHHHHEKSNTNKKTGNSFRCRHSSVTTTTTTTSTVVVAAPDSLRRRSSKAARRNPIRRVRESDRPSIGSDRYRWSCTN